MTSMMSPAQGEPAAAGAAAADPRHEPEIPLVRQVGDVETLKALADPVRLRILRALESRARSLPVMSVKELAEQLGEPQTKLYRHVKVLESTGLIRVAATRLVSGILEQRYQAAQHGLALRGSGLGDSAGVDALETVIATALADYREQLFEAIRAGRLAAPGVPAADGETDRRPQVRVYGGRRSPARAAALQAKLAELLSELDAPDDPDGEPISVLLSYFSPAEPAPAPEPAPDPAAD
jgi:DNA-binding transcriptional ArsR family regulator